MNLLKAAIKSFKKFKLHSVINLFGLTLGITCSVVMFLYVVFQFSFDTFHEDANRIFRVNEIATMPQSKEISSSLRVPYGPALKNEIPEIDDFVRVKPKWHFDKFESNSKQIEIKNIIYADENFFNFFMFSLIQGDRNKVLLDKNGIVLTKKIATTLFG
ncbi:MAG: ABC transporter permease [Salinivirgaceae bacterium]|nr:ABC transporter permease [Salinivirgaceae bacterium]